MTGRIAPASRDAVAMRNDELRQVNLMGLTRPANPDDRDGVGRRLDLEQRAYVGFNHINIIQQENPDAAYYGASVGPADKDRALFRWKLEDGRYEVLFGDLRGEAVSAERLGAIGAGTR